MVVWWRLACRLDGSAWHLVSMINFSCNVPRPCAGDALKFCKPEGHRLGFHRRSEKIMMSCVSTF